MFSGPNGVKKGDVVKVRPFADEDDRFSGGASYKLECVALTDEDGDGCFLADFGDGRGEEVDPTKIYDLFIQLEI